MNLPRKGFQLSDTPTQYGGANFFLAIYSQRRFLAQGTYHLFAAGSNPELLTERVESALEFVEKPTEVTIRNLLRQGVTHIVVNISYEPESLVAVGRDSLLEFNVSRFVD
jgi:hypothetical protein